MPKINGKEYAEDCEEFYMVVHLIEMPEFDDYDATNGVTLTISINGKPHKDPIPLLKRVFDHMVEVAKKEAADTRILEPLNDLQWSISVLKTKMEDLIMSAEREVNKVLKIIDES